VTETADQPLVDGGRVLNLYVRMDSDSGQREITPNKLDLAVLFAAHMLSTARRAGRGALAMWEIFNIALETGTSTEPWPSGAAHRWPATPSARALRAALSDRLRHMSFRLFETQRRSI